MMQIPTAQLGRHVFGLTTASVDTLNRVWNFRWASQDRLGLHPTKQFTGPGNQTFSIPGMIYPGEIGDPYFIEEIAKDGDKGHPLLLVTNIKDVGRVYGYWCLEGCQETSGNLDYRNQARTISFSLSLSFYGDRYGNSTIPNTIR